jgi:hydroxyacylglutathione hydrolase
MPSAPIIVSFRCRSDNVGVLVHDPASGATAAIDAPAAEPIVEALGERGWRLTDILVTHHHGDHVAGIADLVARFRARVVGPKSEADKIARLDEVVSPGDRVSVGGLTFNVLDLAGHTSGHVGYHLADAQTVFVGDTLFEYGCGRLFEGTPAEMWASLSRLKALPDDTSVFYGHDYGLSNGRFALSLDPGNAALAAAVAETEADYGAGRFRSRSFIGREKATNPFLRADDPTIAAAVGLAGAPPEDVLAEVRARKNRF